MRSRRTPRLSGYDYSWAGAYFITTNTVAFEPLFGSWVRSELELTPCGKLVHQTWCDLPSRFAGLLLDEHIVMPDHFHGILWLPSHTLVGPPLDLRRVVGSFKSIAARAINALRNTPGARIWHRSFHDHVIRSERELAAIRRYIRQNPARAMLKRSGRLAGM